MNIRKILNDISSAIICLSSIWAIMTPISQLYGQSKNSWNLDLVLILKFNKMVGFLAFSNVNMRATNRNCVKMAVDPLLV